MDEQIRQIAERLRGLREVLDLTVEEVAQTAKMTVQEYQLLESGTVDISVSTLQNIARKYGVSLDALMFGEEPKMSSYFITRAGKGVSVERTRAYKYQSLGAGFQGRKADPFEVSVAPVADDVPMHLNTHAGQEFNLVMEGSMLLEINGKQLILNQGDSIYFNSELPHGMKALNNKPVKFLAIIL